MSAETDIAAVDTGGSNTAGEVRTALTSVLDASPESIQYLNRRLPDETPHADDDFFDDGTKTGWTESTVTGTATWTEARGLMSARGVSGATGDTATLLKPITASGPPYTIETRVTASFHGVDFFIAGLCFTNGTAATSNAVLLGTLNRASGSGTFQALSGTLTNINATAVAALANHTGNYMGAAYLRIVNTTANTWAWSISADSVNWWDLNVAPTSVTMTPTHYGLFIAQYNSASTPLMAGYDYFRVHEANLDV